MLSIVGQHKLYATLSNFLGIIGYWAGDFPSLAVNDQWTDHWARPQVYGCLLSASNTCISAEATLRSMISDPGTCHPSFRWA